MSILKFSVAVNDRKKSQSGEWEDYPNFIDCTMFGTRAEALQHRLTKGTKVAISGKLHYSSWEKDGKKHSKIDVTVEDIDFQARQQQQSMYSDDDIPWR